MTNIERLQNMREREQRVQHFANVLQKKADRELGGQTIFSIGDIAKLLGVSRRTVERMRQDGRLKIGPGYHTAIEIAQGIEE